VEQIELLRLATEKLDALNISYAIVGSIASGAWGESRFTQDIDILVDLALDQVDSLCGAFPPPDFYVSEVSAHEAVRRQGQFNVIHPASGNKIDFMIAGRAAWSAAQLQRRRRISLFSDHDVDVATPEDVILGKLLYYRDGGSEKHLRDIAGILKISGDTLDRAYVDQLSNQLGVADIWQVVLSRVVNSNL
jgi:hypothetical protein